MPSELIRILGDALGPALFPVLGQPVTWTPQSSAPVEITGIWDTSEEAREGEKITGNLWARLADLPGVKKLDVFTIDDVKYELRSEPHDGLDGAGGVFLKLRKQ